MIASRKILTATALVALGMTLTSLSSPFFGARAEAGQQVDPVSQRIDMAFAVVGDRAGHFGQAGEPQVGANGDGLVQAEH